MADGYTPDPADMELVRNIIMKRGTAWTYATQDARRVLCALAAAGRLTRDRLLTEHREETTL